MNAEIVAVGTEILLGDIVNTNAQYISRRLADFGIPVFYQTVVGDNGERLKAAYKSAFNRANIIITTGGLGPTDDDLTKEIAGEFFNKKLVLHQESLRELEKFFSGINRDMGKGNKKQAYFPEGAIILPNKFGTAPGCIIEDKGKIIINLPGPPREMIPMFEDSVVPYLQGLKGGVFYSKVLRMCGIGESFMVEKIQDILNNQSNPTIAPYAKDGEVILRLTSSAGNINEAKKIMIPVENAVRERLNDFIYGEGDTTLQEVVGKLLVEKNLTIACAESCTGGMVASKLVDFPGISTVFMEGCVTYSNEAKIKRLGVKAETLEKYGAVSKQTAEEMAKGIALTAGVDIGLSTTGIAGPGGGTKEKPVGLVYIGMYINGRIKTRELHIIGSRERVRLRTTIEILDMLRRELLMK